MLQASFRVSLRGRKSAETTVKLLSTQPGTHKDVAVGENSDKGVFLHDLVPAGLQLVPEECIGAPDTVPAGQGEEGGVAVRGETQSGVIPLLPREGGESADFSSSSD